MGKLWTAGLVEQDTNRRRAGVVELARAHRPGECAQKADGDGSSRGDEQHDDAHTGSILCADHRISPELRPTMVSELTGIRIAETSGVSTPVSASVSPAAL